MRDRDVKEWCRGDPVGTAKGLETGTGGGQLDRPHASLRGTQAILEYQPRPPRNHVLCQWEQSPASAVKPLSLAPSFLCPPLPRSYPPPPQLQLSSPHQVQEAETQIRTYVDRLAAR